MQATELHRRICEMLDIAELSHRTDAGPPEALALTSLLLGNVRNATVRRRLANSPTVEDCLTWLAVDRVAQMLPPDSQAGPGLSARQKPGEALAQVVRLAARSL